jgi:hypothetical protein
VRFPSADHARLPHTRQRGCRAGRIRRIDAAVNYIYSRIAGPPVEVHPEHAMARRRTKLMAGLLLGALACAHRQPMTEPVTRSLPPPLPDTTGWGVHLLAAASARDGTVWVGTHGRGVWRLAPGAEEWVQVGGHGIPASVQALAVGEGALWWGSSNHGYGRWPDGRGEPKRWEPSARVALNGIVVAGDTAWIATTRGLRVVRGARVRACVLARDALVPADAAPCDAVQRILPGDYLLAIARDGQGGLWLGDAHGVMHSADGGASWRRLDTRDGLPRARVRAIETSGADIWVATERALYHGSTQTAAFLPARLSIGGSRVQDSFGRPIRALRSSPAGGWPAMALSNALLAPDPDGGPVYRSYGPVDAWSIMWWHRPLSPFAGTREGLRTFLERRANMHSPCDDSTQAWKYRCGRFASAVSARPEAARHGMLLRPVGTELGAAHVDPAQPFGSAGASGISFLAPAGALVRSSGAGVVVQVAAGAAGQDVAVRHGRVREHVVTTVYRGLADVRVAVGDRVSQGDTIAVVAQRGWAAPRLAWEVRLRESTSPADTVLGTPVNPHLWLMPHEAAGTIVGRVIDAAGMPIAGAAVHGITLESATESPFGWLHSYDAGVTPDPAYGESFAITDVRDGGYMMAVDIAGRRLWRLVEVRPYAVTFVTFQP